MLKSISRSALNSVSHPVFGSQKRRVFLPVVNAEANTLYTSKKIYPKYKGLELADDLELLDTLELFDALNPLSTVKASAGAEYSLDGGEWTSIDGVWGTSKYIQIRGYSSLFDSDLATHTLTIAGGLVLTFPLTTGLDVGLPEKDSCLFAAATPDMTDIIGESIFVITIGTAENFTKCSGYFESSAAMLELDTLMGGDFFFDSSDSMAPIVWSWQGLMDSPLVNVDYFFVGESGFVGYNVDQTAKATKIKNYLKTYGEAPAPFSFTPSVGADPSEIEIESTPATITMMGKTAVIAVVGGEYKVNSGLWTSGPGQITVYDTVALRGTASAEFETDVDVIVNVGGVSGTFTITTRAADIVPAAFTFADATGVDPLTLTTSDAITVTGIEADVPISISGGVYSINGGAYTGVAGTVSLNDTVTVQAISDTYDGVISVVLTIGGVSDTFSITTRAADITPAAFSFTDSTNVELSTITESDAITVSGIDIPLAFMVVGGEAEKNDSGAWETSGTVEATDTVKVRTTSSASYETAVNAVLNINGVSDTFTVTTKAADVTPAAFSFTDVTGAELSTLTESDAITVSSIDIPVAFTVAGGEAQINGAGAWGTSGTVSAGDTVKVRVTSSGVALTAVNAVLTIGGVSDTFTVTTKNPVNNDFQLLVKTNNAGTSSSTSIALPVSGTFNVDWGDGNTQTITGAAYTTPTTHDYGVAGNYVIKISTGLTRIQFGGGGDKLKALELQNFGAIVLSTLYTAFSGCSNLIITATDTARFFANNHGINWTSAFVSSLIGANAWANFPVNGAGLIFATGANTNPFNSCTGFNHSLSEAIITGVTDLTGIFKSSGMSAENYSKTLIGWANQVSANGGPFNVNMSTQTSRTYNSTNYGGTPFNNAVDARAYLVLATGSGGAGWTITGDAAV